MIIFFMESFDCYFELLILMYLQELISYYIFARNKEILSKRLDVLFDR